MPGSAAIFPAVSAALKRMPPVISCWELESRRSDDGERMLRFLHNLRHSGPKPYDAIANACTPMIYEVLIERTR